MASNDSKATSPPEYEIKHRLAGAVVLVLAAVVVIPLLLSEPAVEANNDTVTGSGKIQKDFKSRIVPLNINNANGLADSSALVGIGSGGSADATVIDDSRPALLDLTDDSDGSASADSADSANSAVVMTPKAAADDEPEKQEKTESAEPKQQEPAQQQPDQQKPALQVASAAETGNQASTGNGEKPKKKEEAVEVASAASAEEALATGAGWVVRVGTFSKSANVESVASLLTNSGFKPKTTPVSTSLGNSTRVWLGPYAKRETADKISDRLKALTGEKGYVTRTSS